MSKKQYLFCLVFEENKITKPIDSFGLFRFHTDPKTKEDSYF